MRHPAVISDDADRACGEVAPRRRAALGEHGNGDRHKTAFRLRPCAAVLADENRLHAGLVLDAVLHCFAVYPDHKADVIGVSHLYVFHLILQKDVFPSPISGIEHVGGACNDQAVVLDEGDIRRRAETHDDARGPFLIAVRVGAAQVDLQKLIAAVRVFRAHQNGYFLIVHVLVAVFVQRAGRHDEFAIFVIFVVRHEVFRRVEPVAFDHHFHSLFRLVFGEIRNGVDEPMFAFRQNGSLRAADIRSIEGTFHADVDLFGQIFIHVVGDGRHGDVERFAHFHVDNGIVHVNDGCLVVLHGADDDLVRVAHIAVFVLGGNDDIIVARLFELDFPLVHREFFADRAGGVIEFVHVVRDHAFRARKDGKRHSLAHGHALRQRSFARQNGTGDVHGEFRFVGGVHGNTLDAHDIVVILSLRVLGECSRAEREPARARRLVGKTVEQPRFELPFHVGSAARQFVFGVIFALHRVGDLGIGRNVHPDLRTDIRLARIRRVDVESMFYVQRMILGVFERARERDDRVRFRAAARGGAAKFERTRFADT